MREEEKLLVLLSQFELPLKKIDNILNCLGERLSIDEFFKSKECKKLISEELYANMQVCASEARIRIYLENLKNSGIELIT